MVRSLYRVIANLKGFPKELLDDDVSLHSCIAGDQPYRCPERLCYNVTAELLLA